MKTLPKKSNQTPKQLVIGDNKPIAQCTDAEIANVFKYIFVLIGLNKNNLPDEFAKEILFDFVRDELKNIPLHEIKFAFELAVKNKIYVDLNTYGGDFSPKLLMDVFSAYKDYKSSKHKPETHPNLYQQANGIFSILKKQAPETLEYLNEIGKEKKEVKKVVQHESIYQQFLVMFDKQRKKREVEKTNGMFINKYGAVKRDNEIEILYPCNFEEYCTYKLYQIQLISEKLSKGL